MPRSRAHRTQIKVRFSECDPLQIVWHGNYLKYFEDGREAFGQAFDFSYLKVFHESGLSIPLVHVELDFKRSVSYGEQLTVETTMIDDPAAKVIFHYKIFDASSKVVCTGKTIQAFVHLEKKELMLTMPDFFVRWKDRYLTE
jgi:acyl-CoA thioester hydrolase